MKKLHRWLLAQSAIIVSIFIMTASFWNANPPANVYLDMGFPLPFLESHQSILDSISTQTLSVTAQPLFLVDPNFTEIIPKIIHTVVANSFTVIKILLVLQIYCAALFTYLLVRKHTKSTLASITAGIAYISMPFFIQMLNGANSITWGYAVLPLALLGIHQCITHRKWQWSIIAGTSIALATTLSTIQFIFYNGIFIIVYFIFLLATHIHTEIPKQERRTFLKHLSWKIALIVVTIFAISSFYLIPTFTEKGPYARFEGEIEYRKNPFATNFYAPTTTEILHLQNKEWNQSEEIGLSLVEMSWKLRLLPILIVLFALMGLFVSKKYNRYTVPLIAASIIPIYLALPYYEGSFHIWLKETIPGFYTIRTPGRFMIPFLLSLSLCIGYGIASLCQRHGRKWRNGILIASTIIMLVCIIQGYKYGQTFHTFQTTSIEERYPEGQRIIDQMKYFNPKQRYRVLDYTLSIKEGSPHHLKLYSLGNPTLHNAYEFYWRYAGTEQFSEILGNLNVKYIITNPDPDMRILSEKQESSEPIHLPLENRREMLLQSPGIEERYTTPGGITIWENMNVRESTFQAKILDYMGTLQGYERIVTLFKDISKPFAVSNTKKDYPNEITIIDSIDIVADETIERNAITTTPIISQVSQEYPNSEWEKRTNDDLFHTAQINTIFNNPETTNTIHGRTLIAPAVLQTEQIGSLSMKLQRAPQENENKSEILLGLHLYYEGANVPRFTINETAIEPIHAAQPNTTQWLLFALPSSWQELRITIDNTNSAVLIADSYLLQEKQQWDTQYNDMQETLANNDTQYHYIVSTGTSPSRIRPKKDYIQSYKNTDGQWVHEQEDNMPTLPQSIDWSILSEEQDLISSIDEGDLTTGTVSTDLYSPEDTSEQLNFFTKEFAPKILPQPRKFGITLTFIAIFVTFIAIVTLWKKEKK